MPETTSCGLTIVPETDPVKFYQTGTFKLAVTFTAIAVGCATASVLLQKYYNSFELMDDATEALIQEGIV